MVPPTSNAQFISRGMKMGVEVIHIVVNHGDMAAVFANKVINHETAAGAG
ncbi:hypothetical protein H4F33_06695 [Pectobacterium brasiliense]|uniref:Uncharacterized protein n=1 Tax=Pectobacterium brasiliense TaxID=180957 RepID=A0AAE2WC00_9GAMM|nr:hypothetical protein [Pectobacterium brasiliense]MBA0217496.1 hypothetical protein [Pectobacterium brasiliense]MBN3050502.1 hypothetical protein [Pectobacterium brasiliense]MBN3071800.1 hypothetical protein [Pectobacterium brasiliense]MBN3168655.1 hypothetical protein [Pectobacterium brasiliense]